MQFTLSCRGELKANRGVKDKHRLRLHFNTQLTQLWQQQPLVECGDFLDSNSHYGCVRVLAGQRFVPLVTLQNRTLARLAITLLRPGSPGQLFHSGGDIDNRLKTLLDALRMPASAQEMPVRPVEDTHDATTYCLLEDDNLIESISVTTDRLLEPISTQSEVLALIHVTTRSVNSSELWQAISG